MSDDATAPAAVTSAPDAEDSTSGADATIEASKTGVLYSATDEEAAKDAASGGKPDAKAAPGDEALEAERAATRAKLAEREKEINAFRRGRTKNAAKEARLAHERAAFAAERTAYQRELDELRALKERDGARAKLKAENPLEFIRQEEVDFVALTRAAMDEGTPEALAKVALQRAEAAEKRLAAFEAEQREWREKSAADREAAAAKAKEEESAAVIREAETRFVADLRANARDFPEVEKLRSTLEVWGDETFTDRALIHVAHEVEAEFRKAGKPYKTRDIMARLNELAAADNAAILEKLSGGNATALQGAPGKPVKPEARKALPPKTISPSAAAERTGTTRKKSEAERRSEAAAILYSGR